MRKANHRTDMNDGGDVEYAHKTLIEYMALHWWSNCPICGTKTKSDLPSTAVRKLSAMIHWHDLRGEYHANDCDASCLSERGVVKAVLEDVDQVSLFEMEEGHEL